MKQLRLLLWEECNRSCKGCCNGQWDLKKLPVERGFKGYDIIMLTGGEPMLRPHTLIHIIERIRMENPNVKIYVYTAKVNELPKVNLVLDVSDGITLTLHNNSDICAFNNLNWVMQHGLISTEGKSMRLNIFSDVDISLLSDLSLWMVKDNIEWLEDCPLPDGEVFKRL